MSDEVYSMYERWKKDMTAQEKEKQAQEKEKQAQEKEKQANFQKDTKKNNQMANRDQQLAEMLKNISIVAYVLLSDKSLLLDEGNLTYSPQEISEAFSIIASSDFYGIPDKDKKIYIILSKNYAS